MLVSIFVIIIIIAIAIGNFILPPVTPTNNITNSTGVIIVNDGDIISDCAERGIEDKILVIHKEGCPACAIAIPRLEELENELNMDFDFYDLAVNEDIEEVLKIGVVPTHIPAVVIDCKVHIGVLTKEQYKNLIEGI